MTSKHIAMWSCARSRSTLMTRAFEQLEGCVIFDAPFYGAYVLSAGKPLDNLFRQEVTTAWETDYKKVISQITGDLPVGTSFSFQREHPRMILPHFGREWLKSLDNFFLIRHPKEVILSYQKAMEGNGITPNLTAEYLAIDVLYSLFKEVENLTGQTPIVIDSEDLVQNPTPVLAFLCEQFGLDFSENMLSWEPSLKNSQIINAQLPSASKAWNKTWYATINSSNGFLPYKKPEKHFPDEQLPLLSECMPFYEKLFERRVIFSS